MGVSCVMSYPVPEGKTGSQMIDFLYKRMEFIKAEKAGAFSVDCETYHCQLPTLQRSIQVMRNSEQPLSCFAFIENPSGTTIVTDLALEKLIQQLKNFYVKKQAKVEVKGHAFTLGDFRVKIGAVSTGPMTSFRGLLIELEYHPCCVPKECRGIMEEFLTIAFESGSSLLANLSQQFKLDSDADQSPTDVVSQYLDHFLNFKLSTTSATAASQSMSFGVPNK